MKISALPTVVDAISTRAIYSSPHVASPPLGAFSRRSSSFNSPGCSQTPPSSNDSLFVDMGFEKYILSDSDSDSEILPSRDHCLETTSTDYSSQPLADDTLSMTSDDGIPYSQPDEPAGPSQSCSQAQGISQDSDDYDIFAMLDPTDSGSDEALIDVLLNNIHAPLTAEEPEEDEILQQEDGDGEAGEEGEVLDARTQAIQGLQGLILSFLSQLCDASAVSDDSVSEEDSMSPKAKAKKTSGKKIEMQILDRKKSPVDGVSPMRTIKFPGRGKHASSRVFAQLFRVIDVAHEALVNDVPITKRDIYYQDVALFKSQRVVDQLIDDISATIGVGRGDLNVRASSKGLICGSSLVLHLVDEGELAVTDSEGALIPVAEDIARFDLKTTIHWVLIVEKDAVFQTLCRLRFTCHRSLPGPGLIVTGKGYPDLATRQLVKTFSDNLPETVPILALVDGDAYGIDIVSVYKFGSQALKHESERLAAEKVHCIGLWSSELGELGIDTSSLLQISAADEKKARNMLLGADPILPKRWKKELQSMLFTRRKAEIEILSCASIPPRPSSSSNITFEEDSGSGYEHPLVRYLVPRINAAVDELAMNVEMD